MTLQILRSTPSTLELRVYSAGVLTDLDALPTLVMTNGNGDVVTSGAVSKPGAPDNVGVYRSVLPAQADLSLLRAAWSGLLATEPVTLYQDYEIVGNLLFTEAEARNAKIVGGQAALEDDEKYPDILIAGWRSTIGELFEHRMHRGVVQRYCRQKLSGGYRALNLRHGYPVAANGNPLNRPGRAWDVTRILTITHDGTTVLPADVEIVDGLVYYPTGTWTPAVSQEPPLNITVEYEYGPDPVWAEAHQRALDLLLANAAPKGFPSSATSVSTEDGTFRITNFPVAVEEFLKRHNYRV